MRSANPSLLTPKSMSSSPSSKSKQDASLDSWIKALSHGLAVFAAETVVFLWHSTTLSLSSHTLSNPSSPQHLPPNLPSRIIHPISPSPSVPPSSFSPFTTTTPFSPSPVALHLFPSQEFVDFIETVLRTTQVSPQVVLTAILLIDRLKKTSTISGERGSELRLFVVGLVLANKTLDDSAYTNKTWSEVTLIPLPDINRMERQFLLDLRFDLWVSPVEWKAWLVRLDDLQTARRDAIISYRPHQPLAFSSSIQLIPLANSSSQRCPSSFSSSTVPVLSSRLPSLDPSLLNFAPPPTNLGHPRSFVQRPGSSHQQQQRIPQMAMSQLQIGSASSGEQQQSRVASSFGNPSGSRNPLPHPQLQRPSYHYPAITLPPPSFPTLQSIQPSQPLSAPVYNPSSFPFFPPVFNPATVPTIVTPRSSKKKRPAGDAFSSPPQPSTLDTFPPSKRQHRASFDSSTISTPSNPYPSSQPRLVQALPREMMAAMSVEPSSVGASTFSGAQVEFGGQLGGGAGKGAQWPSMQNYASQGNPLYAPYAYQQMDGNGFVQLYVTTVAASPFPFSPSYQTYRKAQLKVQPAPMISQHQPFSSSSNPRLSSNLSQPPHLYPYPLQSQLQDTTFPAYTLLQDQAGPSSWLSPQIPEVPSCQQQQPQPVGAPSGLDWSGLERWRRAVVSSPPTVPAE